MSQEVVAIDQRDDQVLNIVVIVGLRGKRAKMKIYILDKSLGGAMMRENKNLKMALSSGMGNQMNHRTIHPKMK